MTRYFLYFLLGIILLSSCRTTKYVPENEYLMDGYSIRGHISKINKDELENYIRQKPNKKILGLKFHLGLYNLSDIQKDGWWHRSLRTIGEEPVIYDEFLTDKTTAQLELFLRNKGYYNAVVKDSIEVKNRKVSVTYQIKPNKPIVIAEINYSFEDTTLSRIILRDSSKSLLKVNEHFDLDVLSSERERIANYLKNLGYYYFTPEYIFYTADTTITDRGVHLELIIKKFRQLGQNGIYYEVKHPLIRIGKVFLHTEYSPGVVLSDPDKYKLSLDTLEIDSVHLLFSEELKIKPGVIIGSGYILPGELYNLENVRRTYRNLSSLRMFRLVNIEFKQTGEVNEVGELIMDCEIFLTPQTLQSYTVELQGTNSSGNIGAAGNLIYQHRNLLGGAENLDFRVTGAFETLKESYRENFGNMIEFGGDMRIMVPKFFLPFRTDQFIRKYNPATSIEMAYNYQRRPDYTRTVANISFGYNWKGNRFLTHIINPVELNLVSIPFKSEEFSNWLEGKYIFYSYQPHLVTVTNYSLIFNNQNIQKSNDFIFFRMNLESAGNLLSTLYSASGIEKKEESYKLFNTEFAQYLRGDIDLRFYKLLDENNSMVYRFFAGAGLPYGNSAALPFEKKYFAGGANGIRAWQVRNLGPGSYEETEASIYPNKTADIKLEGNIEYRFKLFWVLEGALFLDAGNIWAINDADERDGALFKFDSFYKDLAVGTGFGTRFVFSFFTFRLDFGMKVRDPSIKGSSRWIPGTRKLNGDDFVVNIGIGYPF